MDECKWYGRNTIEAYVNECAKQTEDFILGVIQENLTEHGYHQKIEINGANIKAMIEKQIPKKPICKEMPYSEEVGFYEEWHCPTCGAYVGYSTECMSEPEQMKYCNDCGQHIARDWSV